MVRMPFASLVWRIHQKSAINALKKTGPLAEGLSTELRFKAVGCLAFINSRCSSCNCSDIQNQALDNTVKGNGPWWLNFRKSNDWHAHGLAKQQAGRLMVIPVKIARFTETPFEQRSSTAKRNRSRERNAGSLIGGRVLINLAACDKFQ